MSSKEEVLKYDEAEQKAEHKFGPNYKWIVLSNTTLGALMASIDSSIVLISLPAIFNGLGVNPLVPSNIVLLLWMLLGYGIVTSVFVVTIGRLADMWGRVRLYNFGFMLFALTSVFICVSSYLILGVDGAIAIIALRMFQALGGSFLMANSAPLITDAFPHEERGMALGISAIAYSGGSVLGLLVGGLLAAYDWHLIFLISVPVGVVGAIWSYLALHEIARIKKGRKMDIPGNVLFAAAVLALLTAITYGLIPYGSSPTGFGSPFVIAGFVLSAVLFIGFIFAEIKAEDPMFRLGMFRNKGYSLGNLCMLLAGLARWGLEIMLIIWLQGIWLPLHGVDFMNTPFQAALYMLPLVIGFLLVGPVSGWLSDKYGARLFATAGMLVSVVGFVALSTLPIDFSVLPFMIITFVIGAGQGLFISPNISSIMSSIPPEERGAGSGMRSTIMNSSMMFSIVIFFVLLIASLTTTLPAALYTGLVSQGVPAVQAAVASKIPPTAALFAAFLGYNPLKTLIPGSILSNLTVQQQANITGKIFFPTVVSGPFMTGLTEILVISALMSLVAGIVSALRNKDSMYDQQKERAKNAKKVN